MGAINEQRRECESVVDCECSGRARVAVEVVEFDGDEAALGARVDERPEPVDDRVAGLGSARVEQRLTGPIRIDDRRARCITRALAQHRLGCRREPVVELTRLRLKTVDVADARDARRGHLGGVAHDERDAGGRIRRATELVVDAALDGKREAHAG